MKIKVHNVFLKKFHYVLNNQLNFVNKNVHYLLKIYQLTIYIYYNQLIIRLLLLLLLLGYLLLVLSLYLNQYFHIIVALLGKYLVLKPEII